MSFKNSSLETPGCDMYCGTTPASDVATTHRTIHYDVSITFKYRLFNICLLLDKSQSLLQPYSSSPQSKQSSRVQPRNLCQTRFL